MISPTRLQKLAKEHGTPLFVSITTRSGRTTAVPALPAAHPDLLRGQGQPGPCHCPHAVSGRSEL